MTTSGAINNDDVQRLRDDLTTARSEIKNLRQQMMALTQVHNKDVRYICDAIEQHRTGEPSQMRPATKWSPKRRPVTPAPSTSPTGTEQPITFQPIGVIRTVFPEKRAVPRQPTIGSKLPGTVELNYAFFSNPEHALLGLDGFSHMWIVYHFHRNAPSPTTHAKVAPPRLKGERVGVFSTRSPHRPCAIGLSLVEVLRVEGTRIEFLGTDMVDGTPVLDIKPYIPLYDCPAVGEPDAGDRRSAASLHSIGQFSSREEPDGEESGELLLGAIGGAAAADAEPRPANGAMATEAGPTRPAAGSVRVPDWIMASPTLSVLFNERAETELQELRVDRESIVDVLSADPRSVYIRTKYGSQIFTFQLGDVAVTCKFDDPSASVTIVRIRRTENLPEQNGQI